MVIDLNTKAPGPNPEIITLLPPTPRKHPRPRIMTEAISRRKEGGKPNAQSASFQIAECTRGEKTTAEH